MTDKHQRGPRWKRHGQNVSKHKHIKKDEKVVRHVFLSLLIPGIDLAPPWRPCPFGRGTQLHVGCHCELAQGELVRRLPLQSLQGFREKVFNVLDSAVFFLELRSFAWFWILFSILILSGWSRKWPNLASRSQTSPFQSLWRHWVSIQLELTYWEEAKNMIKQDNNQKETRKSFLGTLWNCEWREIFCWIFRLFEDAEMLRMWGKRKQLEKAFAEVRKYSKAGTNVH